MKVLVADLDEDAAGFGEQVAGDGQAVAQVGQIGMDAVLPGVAERLDLLRLARDLVELAVLDVARARGDLPVRVELDAVATVLWAVVRRVRLSRNVLGSRVFGRGSWR